MKLTENYNLKKPDLTDYVNVADFNENSDTVDGKLKEHETSIGNKETLKTTHKTNIVGAVNELFLSANSGKTDIASAVGLPASNTNTFAQLKTHIQNAKNKGAINLAAKGTPASGAETLDSLMGKIANVNTGKKWASGKQSSSTSGLILELSDTSGTTLRYPIDLGNLGFTPSIILCTYKEYDAVAFREWSTFYIGGTFYEVTGYRDRTAESRFFKSGTNFYLSSSKSIIPTPRPGNNYSWIAIE